MNKWKCANRIFDRCVQAILILVLLLGFYTIYDALYLYRHTAVRPAVWQQGSGETLILPEHSVAWLDIMDTAISYPVMQGKDNLEYLNKDANGQFALSGSIFLDSRNASDWSDPYNLIYGHHMSAGQMFGALDAFLEEDYFAGHREGTLQTMDAKYALRIFAVMQTDASEQRIFTVGEDADTPKADTDALLTDLRERACIFQEPGNGRVLAMSTCAGSGTTKRLVVFATMRKI